MRNRSEKTYQYIYIYIYWKYRYRIKFANELIKETPLKTVLKCRVSSTHRKISEELEWETEQ